MNRRRIGLILIVGGIILAGVIGFLVYLQADQAEQLRAAQPKNYGVVALVDIPDRTQITTEQVDVIRIPDQALPPGDAVYRPPVGASDQQVEAGKAAAKTRVVGQLAGERIYKGEVINTARLGTTAAQTRPSLDIPQGKLWYSLPLGAGGGGAGQPLITFLNFVRAGDFIDIFFTDTEGAAAAAPAQGTNVNIADVLRNQFTRRILQNIKVINVGNFPPGTPSPRAELLITVEVTPDEALTLKWLKDAPAGNMEFVVRSPLDQDPTSTTTTTVTYDAVSQKTGIGTGQ